MLSAGRGGGTVTVRFRLGARRCCAAAVAAAVSAVVWAVVWGLLLTVAGCSSAPAAVSHPAQDAAAYWDRTRLLGALPFQLTGRRLPLPGQAANSRTAGPRSGLRVGALFEHGPTGNHFCTASVVASPGQDLLVTAAHCINGGKGSAGYDSDIVFIPDYRNGQEPFGVWTPARLIVAPQWASSSDPDFDVGFVVLEPHDGKNIQQVLGASRLGTDQGYQYLVHVTGYPDSENVPITCVNWTSRFSDTQLKFACAGYTGGTSGSPWVTRFIAGSHTGTIVGVIGGYQQGGDTPSLSYSVRFGPAILALYRQAVAAESAAQPAATPT
jgi:V8-like Glu-specific endopeptidase